MTARSALRALSRRLHAVEPTAACLAGRQGFGPVVGPDAQRAELMRRDRVRYAAMTPAEKDRQHQLQRESFPRGMGPCQHGVHDFEDCADCRHTPRPPLDYAEGDEPFGYGEEEPPPLFTRAGIVLLASFGLLGVILISYAVTGFGG